MKGMRALSAFVFSSSSENDHMVTAIGGEGEGEEEEEEKKAIANYSNISKKRRVSRIESIPVRLRWRNTTRGPVAELVLTEDSR